MARFDEFRASLGRANDQLEFAISYFEDDDFDSDEDRYCEARYALVGAHYELNKAQQDVLDNVRIVCDIKRLKVCIAECDNLSNRIWSDIKDCDDSFYIRPIRSLQCEIDQIRRDAR